MSEITIEEFNGRLLLRDSKRDIPPIGESHFAHLGHNGFPPRSVSAGARRYVLKPFDPSVRDQSSAKSLTCGNPPAPNRHLSSREVMQRPPLPGQLELAFIASIIATPGKEVAP